MGIILLGKCRSGKCPRGIVNRGSARESVSRGTARSENFLHTITSANKKVSEQVSTKKKEENE